MTHGIVTLFPAADPGCEMPDYEEILSFLAANPPELAAERELHASLLELIAKCLRSDSLAAEEDEILPEGMPSCRLRWMDLN